MTARSLDFYGTTAAAIGMVLALVTVVVSLLSGWTSTSAWIGSTAALLIVVGCTACSRANRRWRTNHTEA